MPTSHALTTRAVGWCLKVSTPSGNLRFLTGPGDISRTRARALMWDSEEAATADIAHYKTGPLANRDFVLRRHSTPSYAARWAPSTGRLAT